MALTYEASPDQVAEALAKHVEAGLRDAIRKRLMEVAHDVVDEQARELTKGLVARLQTFRAFDGCGVQVTIAINGVVLPDRPPEPTV